MNMEIYEDLAIKKIIIFKNRRQIYFGTPFYKSYWYFVNKNDKIFDVLSGVELE